ncbi:hypothetical protein [Natronorarus salvus]|uniref:hypothetical protein n=1 Tax=Natronorarus salvus TaxID=3117733 RepID=UPI002F26851F
MGLPDLSEDVESIYTDLADDQPIALDRQSKTELALLQAALGPESTDELVRRAIHLLFQSTVDTGGLDFGLRREYDVTYDEYLSGMTYEEMNGGVAASGGTDDEARRYQF